MVITRRALLASAVAASSCGCLGLSDGSDEDTPSAEPYRLEPGTYDLIVIMRNDDPAPGYAMDALKAVNEIFIDEQVPVTHGVIPSRGTPLDEADAFCEYVRNTATEHPGLFDVSLHGYTHEAETDFRGQSEFGGLSADEQGQHIRDGIAILEGCVDEPVDTFIPPFNTYDQTTVVELVDAEIPIVSGGKWFTRDYFDTADIPFTAGGALHIPQTHAFVSDWETAAFYSLEDMIAAFDRVYAEGDLYVQMMHYQHFTTNERLDQLRSLLRHIKRDGVGFMTLTAFGNAYLDGTIKRAEEGWEYDPSIA